MGTAFYFNRNYYKQLDDVAMESLLEKMTVVLANIFICHHKRYWLRNCPITYALIIHKRYVEKYFFPAKF